MTAATRISDQMGVVFENAQNVISVCPVQGEAGCCILLLLIQWVCVQVGLDQSLYCVCVCDTQGRVNSRLHH